MPRTGGEDPRGHLRGGTEDASHCSSGPELGHRAGRGSAVLSAPRLKTVSAAHHGPPRPPGAEDPGHLSRGAAAEEPAEPDSLPQSRLCPGGRGGFFLPWTRPWRQRRRIPSSSAERASIARPWTSAIRSTSPNSTGVFRGRTGFFPTWTRRRPGSWRRWRAPMSTGTWPIPTAPTADGKRKTTAPRPWTSGARVCGLIGREVRKCKDQTAGSASWAGKGAGKL